MSQVHHRLAAHFYAASNNGLHPTRNSVAVIHNLAGGRVMPGVGRFTCWLHIKGIES